MGIGERIRVARTRLGREATQKWLAERVGVTTAAISQWENGGRPDLDKIRALRRALRVTFAWLLIGDGPPPHAGDPAVAYEDDVEDRATGRPAAKPTRKAPPAKRRA